MTVWLRQYDNLGDMLQVAAKPPKGRPGSSRSTDEAWTGTEDFESALALARAGWQDKVPMVRAFTGELEHHLDTATVNTFDPVAAVSGAIVDMGKYLTGEPECMIDYRPVKISKVGRVVSLHVSASYNANVSTETVIRFGAAVTALVDLIERTGNTVEVFIEAAGKSAYTLDQHSIRVKVKASTDALDIAKALFCIAHPSFLRRILFSVWEQETEEIRAAMRYYEMGGYGRAIPPMQAVDGAIVLPDMSDDSVVNRNPEAWIKAQLDSLGLLI